MKKIISVMCVIFIFLSVFSTAYATEITLTHESEGYEVSGLTVNSETGAYATWDRTDYVFFPDVDLTGIKSVSLDASCAMLGGNNGETIAIMADDPFDGECLGYVVIRMESGNEGKDRKNYYTNIKPLDGVHDLYFVGSYGKNSALNISIYSFSLSSETTTPEERDYVDDSYILDINHDTWAATDELGRKVADYSEAGPVKDGRHDVGMLYWNWFINSDSAYAYVTSEILAKHPESKDDFNSNVWNTSGKYWWAEPLLGYYDSYDYWVYRRHAEMLSNSGVDFIAFDYTNGGSCFIKPLTIIAQAFRDAKKAGVDIPRLSVMSSLGGIYDDSNRLLKALYFTGFVDDDYSDIWYYLDGKPLIFANSTVGNALRASSGTADTALLNEIGDFFTFRGSGSRLGPTGISDNNWIWLEDFPIHSWNYQEDTGRYEFCAVGVGINESYVYKKAGVGVFSDEYTKGRGFSEAFREDYSEEGKRMAYFFREQSAMALDIDPEVIILDGWNEWTTVRNAVYNGYTNSFVDNFDDENSRDFEPSAGVLRDDYYNLLIDFVRKYKGVEKAPVAGEAVTIDIDGDFSQWEDVAYEYLNYPTISRDSYGYKIAPAVVGEINYNHHHYVSEVYNNIVSAKTSYDEENFYFMAKAENDITTDTPYAMQLYLDIDRNKATGWNGYDYAVNVTEIGKLSKNVNNSYVWEDILDIPYLVSDKSIMLSVPRMALMEASVIDFEFKWTDGINIGEEFLNVYEEGSAAPPYRYNYIYSSIEQVYPGDIIDGLSGNSVMKAGVNKMTVGDSMITVYEPDTRVTPIAIDGTLYVPEDTIHEVIGYGTSKSWYDGITNSFYMMKYELTPYEDEKGVTHHNISTEWLYTKVNSGTMYLNGNVQNVSNAIKVIDGIIFVPLSLLEEAFGYTVAINSGVAVITDPGAEALQESKIASVCNLFE